MTDKVLVEHGGIVRICGRLSTEADPRAIKVVVVSAFDDMKFSDRLKKAADHAKVEWSQTAIGRALGVKKQTADRWMGEGQPAADTVFAIADKLKVDPRWLATGEGEMLQRSTAVGLSLVEEHLLACYQQADPRWQLSIRLLSGLAVEDQLLAATDVNVIVARILGMKPRDLRYPSDTEVAGKLGKAKHVLAREKERSRK